MNKSTNHVPANAAQGSPVSARPANTAEAAAYAASASGLFGVTSRQRTRFLTQAAVIAALYIVLTAIAAGFDLASGAVQVRISEALTILPYFTPAAIPGLIIGCLLSNILTGCIVPDVIFGTLATALGALGTYALRRHRYLCSLPPVIANTIIVPLVLSYAYHIPGGVPYFMLTVGAGEIISCVIFGELLLTVLKPVRRHLFN